MPRTGTRQKSTLEVLHAQKALAQAQLSAAQRKLKTLARKQRALTLKETLKCRQEIGALVEELGLPMDPKILRPLLQLVAQDQGSLSPACDAVLRSDTPLDSELRSAAKNRVWP